MKWDPQLRRYLTDEGEEIPPALIREWIDEYIDTNQKAVDEKSKKLLAGSLTIAAFFSWLSEKIVAMHGAVTVIAFGGEDRVPDSGWAATSTKIQSELDYLAGFQQEVEQAQATAEAMAVEVANLTIENPAVPMGLEDIVRERVAQAIVGNSVSDVETVTREAVRSAIADSVGTEEAETIAKELAGTVVDTFSGRLETLIFGSVRDRARKYADATWSTFANAEKAREGDAGLAMVKRVCEDDSSSCDICPDLATDDYVPFDEVTDIGEGTVCQCRCYYDFSYAKVDDLSIHREVYA